jgi:predicted ferric reductase
MQETNSQKVFPMMISVDKTRSNDAADTKKNPIKLTWRQYFIRLLFFPVPGLDHSIPVIGGKSAFEMAIAVLALVLCILLSIPEAGTAGTIANFIGALVVTLGLRNNILYAFFGLTFERALFWHKFFAMVMICAIIIHGVGEGMGEEEGRRRLDEEEGAATTGFAMVGLIGGMSLLYLASFLNFNVFYFMHVLCFMPLIPLAFLHGAPIFGGFGCVWILDILIRYVFTHKKLKVKAEAVGPNVTKIFFPKTFSYAPGQYCFLMVRNINMYEYHPFSMITSPNDQEIAFLVKNSGDWTKKLYEMASKQGAGKEEDELLIGIEGPNGSLGLDIFQNACHEVVMLVGGGIGITPLLSIWSHILHQPFHVMKKVIIVWCVRSAAEAEAIYLATLQGLMQRAASRNEGNGNEYAVESGEKQLTILPKASPIEFEYHFHITSCKANDVAVWDTTKGSLSNPSVWNAGRPSLETLFHDTTTYCESKGFANVAVFVSGTGPLIKEVHQRCDATQTMVCCGGSSAVRFDCHEEVFGF